MLVNLFVSAILGLGLVIPGVTAEQKPLDCCAAKLACCQQNLPCCQSATKPACCQKGAKCCAEGDGRDRRGQDLLLLCDEIDGEDRRASRRLLQSQAGVL
jgi:hypothetical protein